MRSRGEIETMAAEIIVLREYDIPWKLIQRRFDNTHRVHLWRVVKRYRRRIMFQFERQQLRGGQLTRLQAHLDHDCADDTQLDLFCWAAHAAHGSR